MTKTTRIELGQEILRIAEAEGALWTEAQITDTNHHEQIQSVTD